MKTYVSPRQVARALGVSESTLKRWCDRGLIPMQKTAGGHRRMAVSDVIAFLRVSGQGLAQPELLGLPAAVGRTQWTLDRARDQILQALIDGQHDVVREIVVSLLVAGHDLSAIFDTAVAPALHELGERWSCGDVAIYEERRACEVCMGMLRELRNRLQPSRRTGRQKAIGATLEHDVYTIPVTMAELVLLDAGWNATSLGSNLPVDTLRDAIETLRPDLFWLSVSYVENADTFQTELAILKDAAETIGCRFIVGGQAVTQSDLSVFAGVEHCHSFRGFAEAIESTEASPSEDQPSRSLALSN
jgi:MerR family transcriptional regulator, light-induced transcriptional regulator